MNRSNTYNIIPYLAGIIFLTFVFSCNPQKKIIKEPIKEKGADFLFKQLKINEIKFNCINIKFSAEVLYNKKNNSFNGSLRIRKDSAIWASISPALGIEAARILITNDSIKMLNRLDNTYFSGDYKYIKSLLKADMDFDMLQSLLIGNDFSSYENDVFKASIDGMQYLLSTVGRGKLKKYIKNSDDSLKLLTQDIWLDPDNYKITKVRIKELKENRKLEAEYSDFEKVDSSFFPKKIQFMIVDEKDKMEIIIENLKVSSSCPLEFPFNVSSKYKRVKEY